MNCYFEFLGQLTECHMQTLVQVSAGRSCLLPLQRHRPKLTGFASGRQQLKTKTVLALVASMVDNVDHFETSVAQKCCVALDHWFSYTTNLKMQGRSKR